MVRTIGEAARGIIGAHLCITTATCCGNAQQPVHAIAASQKYGPWQEAVERAGGLPLAALVWGEQGMLRLTQAELEAHPAWPQASGHLPPIRGVLATPLLGSGGQKLGRLCLFEKCQGEFTEADEGIVGALALLASAALEQLALSQAAEAGSREQRALLRTLLHDLRTPLNAILGWTQLLESGTMDPATVRRAVQTIDRNAKAITEAIEASARRSSPA